MRNVVGEVRRATAGYGSDGRLDFGVARGGECTLARCIDALDGGSRKRVLLSRGLASPLCFAARTRVIERLARRETGSPPPVALDFHPVDGSRRELVLAGGETALTLDVGSSDR